LSWLGDDYKQIPREEVTTQLKSNPEVLLPDEEVDIAFKCGRDLVIFTTKRWLKIDTKGWTGQKVSYLSMPFASMRCFEVTGAADHPFDRDAEVKMHCDLYFDVGYDIKKGQGDILGIYSLLNKKCMLGNGRWAEPREK